MAIDPLRPMPRGTGSLVPGAQRPQVVIPPAPIKRAPGTTRLDPDVLKAFAPAFVPPPEARELKARPATQPLDQPEWVGVKRAMAAISGMGPDRRRRLEKSVAAYAKGGGDPKVARGILKQIQAPFDRISQARDHTCAVTSPQQELARRAPARYFRIMKELVADGGAMMAPGRQLDTGKQNYERIMKQDLPMNDRLNLLFQTAGMEFANLSARYNVDADASTSAAETYKGVGEQGAEQLSQALLEGKSDLLGHQALRKRVRALERDHRETGAAMPEPGALRVRALRQLVEESQARGRESFFVKLKVPGGRHHFILDKVDAEGVTLVDQRGARRMTNAELADYLTLEPGRGGYDPGIALTGPSSPGRGRGGR